MRNDQRKQSNRPIKSGLAYFVISSGKETVKQIRRLWSKLLKRHLQAIMTTVVHLNVFKTLYSAVNKNTSITFSLHPNTRYFFNIQDLSVTLNSFMSNLNI